MKEDDAGDDSHDQQRDDDAGIADGPVDDRVSCVPAPAHHGLHVSPSVTKDWPTKTAAR